MKYLNKNLINWLRVMRVSQGFFFITIMPVTLGAGLVLYHGGDLNMIAFLAVFIGAVFFHLGADMINEYYDHINDNHSTVGVKTPFNGGTGVLDDNLLLPKKVLNMSYIFFSIGICFSVIAVIFSNYWLSFLSFLGLLSCWGYSAPPLKFCYRGLGELIIFLNNGFFVIISIYLALEQKLDINLIFVSLFLGFMGAAIILMNELPDYDDDKRVNKKNLIVRFGIVKGIILWRACIILAYLSLILACLLGSLPMFCLISLFSLFYTKNYRLLTQKITPQDLASQQQMSFLCAQTIKLKFHNWQLIMLGFIINYFVN